MKDKVPLAIEQYRLKDGFFGSTAAYGFNGMFFIPYQGNLFTVMISDQMEWDHVSVSLPVRCPTWEEMCYIKRIFFKPEETVIQFHPPRDDYISYHPYCLHLWRNHKQEYILPPKSMIAPE